MSKEIYPESVFKEQQNGIVFYKEGKLNDPLMGEPMEGIFQSWKYSFDNGKQIFKATDSEKVYEKRLIKDRFGNPHWSGWMEICPGEANGIQAIAVNNQPLQLPNSDGAIKLQITPQMIDTYSRREIYNMINSKVEQTYMAENYEYVVWIDGCSTPKEVLEKTYGESGGEQGKYYLVEPKPVKGEPGSAAYFIWAERNDGHYDWLSVASPNMNAFVTYTAWNDHIYDEIMHVTQADRDNWDSKLSEEAFDKAVEKFNDLSEELKKDVAETTGKIEQKLENTQNAIDSHIVDIGQPTSPHVTIQEREKINKLFNEHVDLPKDVNRYVVEGGKYTLAFEQIQQAEHSETVMLNLSEVKQAYSNGDAIISVNDRLVDKVKAIADSNELVEDIFIELSNISVYGDNNSWYVEADNGYTSEVFYKTKSYARISIPFAVVPDSVVIKMTNSEGRVAVGSVKAAITKKAKLGIDIGDTSKVLPLNLVGPENVNPTYNGQEIQLNAGDIAKWGKITGDINVQEDLDIKIANALKKKIDYADIDSHLRWDVYRDGIIKSIIQQPSIETTEKTVKFDVQNGQYNKGAVLVDNIKSRIKDLKAQGYVIYSSRFVAENISVYQNEKKEMLPVSFKTDNAVIPESQLVVGQFTWNWPGDLFNEFDKIILSGNNAEYITAAYLELKCIKYGDIEIGLFDESSNTYMNITMKSQDLANEVNNFIVRAKESIVLKADENAIIEAKKNIALNAIENGSFNANNLRIGAVTALNLGKKTYAYDDEKEDATISVYGQEIDARYAARDKFEALKEDHDTRMERAETNIVNILNKHQEDMDALTEKHDADLQALTNKHDADIAEITSQLETNLADYSTFKGEVTAISTAIKNHVGQTTSDLNARMDSIDTTHIETMAKLNAIENSIDSHSEALQNQANEIEDIKDSYLKVEDYKASEQPHAELYDLIIEDSDQLNNAIADGTLEKTARVLLKTGDYTIYDENVSHTIDFSHIKVFAGEVPCTLRSVVDEQAKPVNFTNTKFAGVDICLGHKSDVVEIDAEGRRAATLENVAGEYSLKLKEYIDVYKLKIEGDTEILLEDSKDNREYTLYIDQGEEVHNVKFTNFITNTDAEFLNGLENQKAKGRTLIKLIADDETSKGAFIVENVIYGLTAYPDADALIQVIVRSAKCELYNSDVKVPCVANYSEGDIVGQYHPGNVFTFNPTIVPGFAHALDGIDYKLTSESGVDIGAGKCFENTAFKIPATLHEGDKIYVDFMLKPQLATIVLDKLIEGYVEPNSLRGFTRVQAGYNAQVSMEMIPHFEAYGYTSDIMDGAVYEGALPWVFRVPEKDTFEDFEIAVKPLFYGMIDNFDMKVINNTFAFNTSEVALLGENTFDIIPHIPEEIASDTNFGRLYTLVPITLIQKEGVYSGDIDEILNGKDYEANITFEKAGDYVDIDFIIAESEKEVTKRFFITYIDDGWTIDSVENLEPGENKIYTLDTYVSEGRQYGFTVNFGEQQLKDYNGTWKTSNSNVSIISKDDNSVVIAADKKGESIVTFTSAFTGFEYSFRVKVVTHAKKAVGENMSTNADTTIEPKVFWYDYNEKKISPALLTNSEFVYAAQDDETSSEFLNDEYKSYLVVTNARFPEGQTTVTAFYSVIPEDTECETEVSEITIIPKKYLVNWNVDDDAIKSITIYEGFNRIDKNCYATGGTTLKMTVVLNDNKQFKYLAALENAFENVEVALDIPGHFIANVDMPYAGVSFGLGTAAPAVGK